MGVFILTGEFSSANFVLSTKLEESHSQPEKTMLMRTRTFILCLLALCLSTIRGYASGLDDFRVNARFLTDRMAFELHLNSNQYNDLYEINYDFLCNIGPYVSGIAVADTRAMDAYYRYLDERNDDLDGYFHKPNTYASSILNISSVPFMPSITYAICVCIKFIRTEPISTSDLPVIT